MNALKAVLVLQNPKSGSKEWRNKLQLKDCRLHADLPDGEEIQLTFDSVYTQPEEFYKAQEFLYFTVINQLEDGNIVVWSHIKSNSHSNVFESCNNFLHFFLSQQVGNSLERLRVYGLNSDEEYEEIQDYDANALDKLKETGNILSRPNDNSQPQNATSEPSFFSVFESLLVAVYFGNGLVSCVLFTEQIVEKNLLLYAGSCLQMESQNLAERQLFKFVILEMDEMGMETLNTLKDFQRTLAILQETTQLFSSKTPTDPKLNTLEEHLFDVGAVHKENARDQNVCEVGTEGVFDVATYSESDRESECDMPLSQLEKHQIFKKMESVWKSQQQNTTDESNPLDVDQQLETVVENSKSPVNIKRSAEVPTVLQRSQITQTSLSKELVDEREYNEDDIRERISELESLMNQQLRLRGSMMREVSHNSSQSSANTRMQVAYIGDDALSDIRKEIRCLRERLSRTTGNESISSSLDTSKETSSSHPSISSLRVSQVSSSTEKEGANNLLSSLEDIRSRVNALKEPPRRHRRHRLHTNDSERSTTSEQQSSTNCENQWVNATEFFADPKRQAHFGMQGRSSDFYFANSHMQTARPSDIYLRREKYFGCSNIPGRSSDANLLNVSRGSFSNHFPDDYSRIPSYSSYVSDTLLRNSGSTGSDVPEKFPIRNSQNHRERAILQDLPANEQENARRISFRDGRPSEQLVNSTPAVSRPIAVHGPKYSPQTATQEAGSDIRAEGELWQRKGHLVKFWRRRFVAILQHSVFGNVLCIFEMEKNQTLQPTKSKMLALKQTQVKSEPNTIVISGKPRYVFRLQTSTSEFFFAAADSKSRQYWIEKLRTASRKA
ncbi:hypothetical protein GpartN1_g3466.t1 [Galdieria partita]|uniref:PH domain-containing protein n=1 Tax=Galdieria partita TaxID=83374 RepID=A0A9C7PW19_9RHOD|nr:hypothetical protein GpartN1_g3466.t1 [Galdieria partita]